MLSAVIGPGDARCLQQHTSHCGRHTAPEQTQAGSVLRDSFEGRTGAASHGTVRGGQEAERCGAGGSRDDTRAGISHKMCKYLESMHSVLIHTDSQVALKPLE